jgi:hypothetical protein
MIDAVIRHVLYPNVVDVPFFGFNFVGGGGEGCRTQ